jgi:putative membrane protein
MNLYLLFKSLHLIAVISWMAGLLYLPRIFVYHSEAQHDSQKEIFKVMERRLYNYIMMPAMLLSWIFGVLLIHSLGITIFAEL